MDHLHTYCMKKFAHLLWTRGIECGEDEALHARFGKYRKELLKERDLNHFTDQAPEEARYVFDTISAILIFFRAVEAGRYEE